MTKQWVGCSPSPSPLLNMPGPHPVKRPRPVLWKRPQPSWCKLNTDGTFTPSAERSGGGRIIRDEHGDIIVGFYQPLIADSSIEAELLALAQGLEMAKEVRGNIWIEMDAEIVVDNIREGCLGASTHSHVMARIINSIRDQNWKISHIHREGNKVADKLASLGYQEQYSNNYDKQSAPPMIKALVHMNQLGFPSFWFQPP